MPEKWSFFLDFANSLPPLKKISLFRENWYEHGIRHDPDPHLVQTCSMGFVSGLLIGKSMASTPCCARKTVVSCAVWGMSLFRAYTTFRPKTSPREAYYREGAWSWGFYPAPLVHSSHHGEWHLLPWMGLPSMHAFNQFLPLPVAHTSTIITVKRREARLVTEDTVPPVPAVPPSAASPVIQSQSETPGGTPRPIASSQKPVYNAPNWLPPKSADHLHEPRWNDSIRINCLSSRLWLDFCDLRASADVADQCLGCVAKFSWCILVTHPTFLPLPIENSPQTTTWKDTTVFALTNYVAWCPKNEKVKWFSKKHTYYWTVNLLGRLHPKWQQLGWLPFQSVPTLYMCTVGTDRHSQFSWLGN